MHAASEHQAGFYFALQLIADGFVWVFERIDDAFEVAPEVGAHRNFEGLMAAGGHREAFVLLTFCQQHAVELDVVVEAADWQAYVIGVVDAKA